jgi:hypothetical protein
MTPTPPHAPQLPPRRVSAILAAIMLAAGIALGALIGPGPAASLASTSRAAAVGRVLALLALGGGTSSGSDLLLSSGAVHPPAASPQPTPAASQEATAEGGSGAGSANASSGSARPSSTSATTSPSSGSASPTSSTSPAASGGGKKERTPAVLPPIANVWLVVLPYGGSLESALKQSTAAPYLDGQLVSEGAVLSDYSSLATSQLAGAATLLSGQVTASVSTIAPPPCGTGASGTGATSGAASSPAAGAPGQAAASAPCPSGEPAGVQAADAFLQEVVPKIMASAAYREHGLLAITFAPASQAGAASTATTPAAGTTETAGTGVAYPAGSLASTVTAEGSPAGTLLLSPFLRHVGTRSASAFDPTAPRTSLEGLFHAKAAGS